MKHRPKSYPNDIACYPSLAPEHLSIEKATDSIQFSKEHLPDIKEVYAALAADLREAIGRLTDQKSDLEFAAKLSQYWRNLIDQLNQYLKEGQKEHALQLHSIKGSLTGVESYLGLVNSNFFGLNEALKSTREALIYTLTQINSTGNLAEIDLQEGIQEKLAQMYPDALLKVTHLNAKKVNGLVLESIWSIIENTCQLVQSPEITITSSKEGGRDIIYIIDNGPGFSEEALERVFSQDSYSTKGTSGIGLYLSQQMMQKIGGDLQVTMTSEDGTIFKVILPEG